MHRSPYGSILIAFLLLVPAGPISSQVEDPAAAQETAPQEEPRDVGLVEETGRRLLQIDVSVRGPAGEVDNLTAADFRLTVGGRTIEEFTVDRVCVDGRGLDVQTAALTPEQAVELPEPPGLNLLFYFDQFFLTARGRVRSLEVARELVVDLIHGNNRAAIVSSGLKMRTVVDLTSDRELLLAGLQEVANDPEQVDSFASTEEMRVQRVYQALGTGMSQSATMAQLNSRMARDIGSSRGVFAGIGASPTLGDQSGSPVDNAVNSFLDSLADDSAAQQREGVREAMNQALDLRRQEQSHTRQGLNRFALALGGLADEDPPKAVVYFADRVRSNPGDHFLELFNFDKMSANGDPSLGWRAAHVNVGASETPAEPSPGVKSWNAEGSKSGSGVVKENGDPVAVVSPALFSATTLQKYVLFPLSVPFGIVKLVVSRGRAKAWNTNGVRN